MPVTRVIQESAFYGVANNIPFERAPVISLTSFSLQASKVVTAMIFSLANVPISLSSLSFAALTFRSVVYSSESLRDDPLLVTAQWSSTCSADLGRNDELGRLSSIFDVVQTSGTYDLWFPRTDAGMMREITPSFTRIIGPYRQMDGCALELVIIVSASDDGCATKTVTDPVLVLIEA